MAVKSPGITIPTGYESEQRRLARKQEFAQALMQQGMQQNNNMVSPFQGLSQVAQTILGALIAKKLDKQQTSLDGKILQDWQHQNASFDADAAAMTPEDIVAKYSTSPMMESRLDPYRQAVAAELKQRREIVQNGGVWARKGDLPGTAIPSKPGDDVIVENGQARINPLAVTAALLKQGYTIGGDDPYSIQNPTASMPWPGAQGNQLMQRGPSPQPTGGLMMPDQVEQMFAPLRGPGSTEGMSSPEGNVKVIGGRPYFNINGKWYDNPEGR